MLYFQWIMFIKLQDAGITIPGEYTWYVLVIELLIKKFSSRRIVQGSIKPVKNGRKALLDFGDDRALLFINGGTESIIFK